MIYYILYMIKRDSRLTPLLHFQLAKTSLSLLGQQLAKTLDQATKTPKLLYKNACIGHPLLFLALVKL